MTSNDIAILFLISPIIYVIWTMFKPLTKEEKERADAIAKARAQEIQKIYDHKFAWEK